LRLVLISGGAQACGLVLLTLGRLAYFGQALPNTFYAKVGSLPVGRGARYLGEFLWQNHAWLWLALVLMALPFAWKRQRLALAVLLAQVALWCGWLVGFGGGQWEFRLFVPVLPALALLLAIAFSELGRARTTDPTGAEPRRPQVLLLRHAGVAVTIVVIGLSQWQVLRTPFRPFGDLFPVEQLDEMARFGAESLPPGQSFRVSPEAAPEARATLTEVETEVLECAAEGFAVGAIADVVSAPDSEIYKALAVLLDRGILERQG